MKFLPLVWKNIWRRKFRTVFTLLSIFIAFVLFGILMTIRQSFTFGVEIAGADRLVLIHKVSLIMPLPVSYKPRLEQTKGVERATHQTWFGGIYQDPANFFANMAVEPDVFLKVYPEFVVPPDQVEAWQNDRQGAIVGVNSRSDSAGRSAIACRSPRRSSRPKAAAPHGSSTSSASTTAVTLSTKRRCSSGTTTSTKTGGAAGTVGWYVVKISDPAQAVDLSHTFDEMFANSSAETKTTTEKGFVEGFAKQIGDIGSIMIAISSTVLFMFGLVAASTMAQSVRERTSELAVLKTLGSRVRRFSRSSLPNRSSSRLPAGCSASASRGFSSRSSAIRRRHAADFRSADADLVIGVGLMVLMGMLAGLMPALAAMRLKITDALRRT